MVEKWRRGIGADRLVDVAGAADVVAVAPAALEPELARRLGDRRQEAGVGGSEVPGAVAAAEARPVRRVVVRRVDVVARARRADPVQLVLGGARVEDVVDVGVVAAAVVGDVGEAVAGLRVGEAAPARVGCRDAGDAVVGVDHRRRVAEVVGVRVVERHRVRAKARDAEVERVAVRRQQAAQDAARDVAARVRIVAVDDLAAHRRVHRLGVVEDDHHVGSDRRRQEQRVAREREGGAATAASGADRSRAAIRQAGGDRLHGDLR